MSYPKSRWAVVCGLSLGLNLFFLGALSHRVLSHRSAPEGPGAMGPRGLLVGHDVLHMMVGVMGGPKDPRAQPVVEQGRKSRQEKRHELLGHRRQLTEILREKPFSEARFADALAQLGRSLEGARGAMDSTLVTLAAQMTPEERERFAEKLSHYGRK